MFEEIEWKIKGEFGCVCICLNNYFGNEIRKKFVEEGLKFGFKTVEIINYETAVFLNAMSQSKDKPINGDVIWIKWFTNFHVWKIEEKRAKFVGQCAADPSKIDELQKIMDEMKVKREPNFVICEEKIDQTNFRQISPAFQFFIPYIFNYNFISGGSLLKARITSGDPDLIHLDTERLLFQQITLKIRDKLIVTFKNGQKLPIIHSQKIIKKGDVNYLDIYKSYKNVPEAKEESFKLSNSAEIDVIFKVDTNEIYSVSFINSSNGTQSKISKSNNFFAIPQKDVLLKTNFQAIGIDLGTSRCCAAVNRKNGVQTVPLDNTGERLLPSYISYDEKNVKCGRIVIHRLRTHSKSTIFDSKRIIGRNFNDIEIDENWNFTVTNENEKIFLEIYGFNGKQKFSAEKVASELLKNIKMKAEEFQGEKIPKVVITVPAAFTDAQKVATIKAAKLAGWNEIELLPEPIAAAFAYFIDRSIPNNSTVLLFDLGGGTLDVCIFKIQNNQIQIISNTGDSKLGGRNFDTILINYFKNLLNANYGISVLKDKKYKLIFECQNIKEDLSSVLNSS
uniref:Heat shock protein 70 n=1 Tax=Panagrolaimus sp. ES5 TaxID=591445 RepID=A0AC34FIN9_9BILA